MGEIIVRIKTAPHDLLEVRGKAPTSKIDWAKEGENFFYYLVAMDAANADEYEITIKVKHDTSNS